MNAVLDRSEGENMMLKESLGTMRNKMSDNSQKMMFMQEQHKEMSNQLQTVQRRYD